MKFLFLLIQQTILMVGHCLFYNVVMAGEDYISIFEFENFTSGSPDGATKCVDIRILDDDALEGEQTFTLTLTTSDPDVMLGNNVTTITIIDNEGR
jgi:hypothetical protein